MKISGAKAIKHAKYTYLISYEINLKTQEQFKMVANGITLTVSNNYYHANDCTEYACHGPFNSFFHCSFSFRSYVSDHTTICAH